MRSPGLAKARARLRLLLADGDERMRAWLKEALAAMCAECSEVANGFELLDRLAEEGPYDLVITGVSTRPPSPTGLQVAAMAREAGLGTPFLVLAPREDSRVAEVVRAVGRAELLSNPFDVKALLGAVRGLLDSHVALPLLDRAPPLPVPLLDVG